MSPLSESSLFVLLRPLRLIGVIRRVCSRCLAPAASPDSIEDPSLGSLAVSFWRMLALSRGDPPVPGRSLPGLATFYYFFSLFVLAFCLGCLGGARGGREKESERNESYLVDPASSHMLVSKTKPCMSKFTLSHGETANGSLNQSRFLR